MRILDKKVIGECEGTRITALEVLAPEIAAKARAGQFVVLMAREDGERIPLTVVDTNVAAGSITLILQELGLTTKLLGGLKKGDSLYAIVGPLGHATPVTNYGKVIIVAGGVGIAEVYPVARALKKAGNRVIVIIGARTKALLFLEKELSTASDELHIATDDGSRGKKGFTTDVLVELLSKGACDLVYAVGPIPMMKKASVATRDRRIRTIVSLNAIMVDGTGMCGSCRVTVAGKTMFSCVDGPEFDGHAVDWDELAKRNNIYQDKEKHICRLSGLA
jgi:ferredoxin--NADP+ reductase